MKHRKPQRNLTPIGTVLNNMKLIKYLSMIDFELDRRREFLLECLFCGHTFNLVNRYFLRSERNQCPKCKGN